MFWPAFEARAGTGAECARAGALTGGAETPGALDATTAGSGGAGIGGVGAGAATVTGGGGATKALALAFALADD